MPTQRNECTTGTLYDIYVYRISIPQGIKLLRGRIDVNNIKSS